MQPFERLRRIARHSGDDRTLVAEAADCLAEFDADPAGLVVTCRRLLTHHPDCAPLWWLCARVLAAPDPSDAAWEAEGSCATTAPPAASPRCSRSRTSARSRCSAGPSSPARRSSPVPISRCSRCGAPHGDDSWRARLARSDASARPVDAIEASALEPSHVLVEIEAASPTRALVLDGTSDAARRRSRKPTTLVWLVAGVGRVLPARLFDAMVGRLDPPEDHGLELVDVQMADRIAGPTGLERPEHLIRRVDAPVAPELLRLD